MSEANKAIYRRAWQELMNQRNVAIVDELFAPNYVLHDPHVPLNGREALKRFTTALHQGFSDLRLTTCSRRETRSCSALPSPAHTREH